MSFCANCGSEERVDQRFCPVCGAPRPSYAGASPMPALSTTTAIARLGDAQVLVGIALEPPRQSRWSLFFRFFLTIPIVVVGIGVVFAGFFVAVGAWFTALFTGRVSDGQQRFLTKVLRFNVNLGAYANFLTSRWPGLCLNEKPDDQVRIDIDHVGLRRWSVFFRGVLGYPASLVGTLVSFGVYPFLLVAWFCGLVTGHVPRALHQTIALALRYQARLYAYAWLLTPTQPFRSFLGDGEEVKASPAPDGVAASPAAEGELPTRWVVMKAARVMMIVVIVFSVPLYLLTQSLENHFLVRVQDNIARPAIDSSHVRVDAALRHFRAVVDDCPPATIVACRASAASGAYAVVAQQSTRVTNDRFVPISANGALLDYEFALAVLLNDLRKVQVAASNSAQSDIIDLGVAASLSTTNARFHDLNAKLGG